MPSLMLIDGEKGGVGKSMFCRTLAEYFQTKKIPFALIDTDRTNPDVGRVYDPKRLAQQQVFFSESEEAVGEMDNVFEVATEINVIVNLPAQVAPIVNKWIEDNDLLELACECGIQLSKWFVCTGEVDSIHLFLESLKTLNTMPHILVRNLGAPGARWNEENEELERAIQSARIPVVDLQKLPKVEREYIQLHQCTFAQAAPKLQSLSKARLNKYLKAAYTAIAATGLIPETNAEVESA